MWYATYKNDTKEVTSGMFLADPSSFIPQEGEGITQGLSGRIPNDLIVYPEVPEDTPPEEVPDPTYNYVYDEATNTISKK